MFDINFGVQRKGEIFFGHFQCVLDDIVPDAMILYWVGLRTWYSIVPGESACTIEKSNVDTCIAYFFNESIPFLGVGIRYIQ